MIGRTLAHYKILEKIGSGGMGDVFKARDTKLERSVAVKILPSEAMAGPERRRRFVQEARAASVLDPPHIVTVHDIAEVEGVHSIVMQLVSGFPPMRTMPLWSLPGRERDPALSPDGKQVAFVWIDEVSQQADLYVQLIDTENRIRLTNDASVESDPAWSPDGKEIAFLRLVERRHDIVTVPVLGGPARRLGSSISEGHSRSWSPDGRSRPKAASTPG